jgi:uncharacterized membrane protein
VRRRLVIRGTGILLLLSALALAGFSGLAVELVSWSPALGYFLVMVAFGRTLAPGKEPLITTYTRLDKGHVFGEVRGYTRGLTVLWTVLMAALLLETVALRWFGPASWLAPASLFNVCLMIGVFLGEHWVRRITFPHLPMPSPWRTGQVMMRSLRNR